MLSFCPTPCPLSILALLNFFSIFCRLWHNYKSKLYPIDIVNFGTNFESSFKLTFNPCFPLAALKYNTDLWLVLLPGKRRSVQGQILYRHFVSCHYWSLQSCQWSPDGKLLLIITKTENLRKQGADIAPATGILLMVKDFRGRYVVEEVKSSWDVLPLCDNPTQLSSESKFPFIFVFWHFTKKLMAGIFGPQTTFGFLTIRFCGPADCTSPCIR